MSLLHPLTKSSLLLSQLSVLICPTLALAQIAPDNTLNNSFNTNDSSTISISSSVTGSGTSGGTITITTESITTEGTNLGIIGNTFAVFDVENKSNIQQIEKLDLQL